MFCTNCGKEIDDNWKFCKNCGYPINNKELEDIIAPTDIQRNNEELENNMDSNNIQTDNDDAENNADLNGIQTDNDEVENNVNLNSIQTSDNMENNNESNSYYEKDKKSKNNSFIKIPLFFFIITVIVIIINYFIEIDILYHMKYGDVKDFFLVTFNAIIITIPSLIISCIMSILIKVINGLDFDNLMKKTIYGIFIIFSMLIALNYDYNYNYFGNNYNEEKIESSIEQKETTSNSSSYKSSSSSTYNSSDRDLDAWICAVDAIEQHLFRYSNVKVSNHLESNVKYNSVTDIYTITGTVSYKNEYNATVNAYYYVELELTAEGYKNAYTYVY